ncbi:hypothetical protein TRIATDRAFT_258448 [Trichoderma atroviride IMI 206040]|uniref:Uncharacterized protein n=1 Tax=Hypocrea atroviridis (strain ATCC 20476 / IMI 206040) TaxID=452589 RepID=G9P0R0_HYPAI|nr:uncharacterized protein TRIATDRAFT_301117 [Trichoderma atroviride IMI 206040]EHK43211.1 hypothetical protein TRIATDRAFT_258448 [Trichoderma atroviride IMI 206040]
MSPEQKEERKKLLQLLPSPFLHRQAHNFPTGNLLAIVCRGVAAAALDASIASGKAAWASTSAAEVLCAPAPATASISRGPKRVWLAGLGPSRRWCYRYGVRVAHRPSRHCRWYTLLGTCSARYLHAAPLAPCDTATPPSLSPSLPLPLAPAHSPQLGLPLSEDKGWGSNAGAGGTTIWEPPSTPCPFQALATCPPPRPSSTPSRHPARWTLPCSTVAHPQGRRLSPA